jgi:Ca2+/Na+ antiporter
LANVLFWLFSRTSHRVVRLEGAVLVLAYVGYIAYLISQL